jgi:hypothetical protein
MGFSPRNPTANQVFKLYGSLPAKLKNPKNGVGCGEKMSGINPEPNPGGTQGVNPEVNSGGNPEVKLCEVATGYQGTTHIRKVEAIFSLKKNKFIKPMKIEGDSVTGRYVYELYPGKYILLGYRYVARETPSRQLYAQYISVNHDCSVVYGQSTVILFETEEWLMNQAIPQMLKGYIQLETAIPQ